MADREQSGRAESSSAAGDDWSNVTDPAERRKIQNKLAQRKFREKAKQAKEDSEREAENQKRAGNTYRNPEPEEVERRNDLSGLPWGGVNMRHFISSAKGKEQSTGQESRDASTQQTGSRAGRSSGVGLRLTEDFARGEPVWRVVKRLGSRSWG